MGVVVFGSGEVLLPVDGDRHSIYIAKIEDFFIFHTEIKEFFGQHHVIHAVLLNLSDVNLIEALWNMGKLDEFFKSQKDNLTHKQKQIFFQFLENMYEQFQEKLTHVKLKPIEEMEVASSLEMEIFKEETRKNQVN